MSITIDTNLYAICEKCGIKRNVAESPKCPFCFWTQNKKECRDFQKKLKHQYERRSHRKILITERWCAKCQKIKKRARKHKFLGGGLFFVCDVCKEILKTL